MTFIDSHICHRMARLRMLYSVTVTNAQIHNDHIYRYCYSSSNGTIASVVIHDLEILFQYKIFPC